MEGLLQVQKGGKWVEGHQRYFVVDATRKGLTSGKTEKAAKSSGAKKVPFSNLVKVQVKSDGEFEVCTKKKTYLFRAGSESEAAKWIQAIEVEMSKNSKKKSKQPPPTKPTKPDTLRVIKSKRPSKEKEALALGGIGAIFVVVILFLFMITPSSSNSSAAIATQKPISGKMVVVEKPVVPVVVPEPVKKRIEVVQPKAVEPLVTSKISKGKKKGSAGIVVIVGVVVALVVGGIGVVAVLFRKQLSALVSTKSSSSKKTKKNKTKAGGSSEKTRSAEMEERRRMVEAQLLRSMGGSVKSMEGASAEEPKPEPKKLQNSAAAAALQAQLMNRRMPPPTVAPVVVEPSPSPETETDKRVSKKRESKRRTSSKRASKRPSITTLDSSKDQAKRNTFMGFIFGGGSSKKKDAKKNGKSSSSSKSTTQEPAASIDTSKGPVPRGMEGAKFAKYVKMLQAGLPEGAVRNAMARDGVSEPKGAFEDSEPVYANKNATKDLKKQITKAKKENAKSGSNSGSTSQTKKPMTKSKSSGQLGGGGSIIEELRQRQATLGLQPVDDDY